MKQTARRTFFRAAQGLGVTQRLHRSIRRQGLVPILVYHRVSPVYDPAWPPLTPQQFEAHLQLIRRRFRPITLEELTTNEPEALHGCCVVNFDDAWADFQTHALPLLERYQVPVALAVPTQAVDGRELIWTSRVDACVNGCPGPELHFSFRGKTQALPCRTDEERLMAAIAIQTKLRKVSTDELKQALADLEAAYPPKPAEDLRPMTWAEIRALPQELVTLTSHGHRHHWMPALSDAELEDDLATSKGLLEASTGRTIDTVAYPIGGMDERTVAAAARHYTYGMAATNRPVNPKMHRRGPARFTYPRFNVSDAEAAELDARIAGLHARLGR